MVNHWIKSSIMPYKEYKAEKLYYSISEAAEIIGESTSLVRFWSDKFSKYIKPERNNKGNRKFTPKDIDTLKLIHYLVKDRGMTLDGAADRMKVNRDGLDRKVEVIGRIKGIRDELMMISRSLEAEETGMRM